MPTDGAKPIEPGQCFEAACDDAIDISDWHFLILAKNRDAPIALNLTAKLVVTDFETATEKENPGTFRQGVTHHSTPGKSALSARTEAIAPGSCYRVNIT
jgi:hypothetical protein